MAILRNVVFAAQMVTFLVCALSADSARAHGCHHSPAYAPGLEDHYHDPTTCKPIPLGTLEAPAPPEPSRPRRPEALRPLDPPTIQPDQREPSPPLRQ
jgi:hypothetical protein